MARIRSIKPELRTSLVVADWPRDVRYLFVLLWGYLDDHGYGVDDARLIKADCLPLDDDVDRSTLDGWLGLIERSGPLCRYFAEGKRYLHIPSWTEHQKPQHPKASRIPLCPHHDLGQPHEDRSGRAGPIRSDLHEDLMKPSSGRHADLTPEQGAGSREVEQGAGEPAAPRRRGQRIPDDFTVTPEMVAWAVEHCPGVDGRTETQKFINYWRSKTGKDATKLDWRATWQNWLLNARDRYGAGARASPNGVKPSTTDARVAEGLALAERLERMELPQ